MGAFCLPAIKRTFCTIVSRLALLDNHSVLLPDYIRKLEGPKGGHVTDREGVCSTRQQQLYRAGGQRSPPRGHGRAGAAV
jgi:hypothetical protein